MRDKITTLFAISILLFTVLGCSSLNPLSGIGGSSDPSSGTTTPGDTIGFERIGIEECDAVVDELAAQAASQDDGYIVKSIKGYYVDKIREALKKSVEENKGDPEKLRKECINFKAQLDRYRAEEAEKNQ
jgi:hypothetical protein